MAIFTGSAVALVTPFKDNGDVDLINLRSWLSSMLPTRQMLLLSAVPQVRQQPFHMKSTLSALRSALSSPITGSRSLQVQDQIVRQPLSTFPQRQRAMV